MCGYSGFFFVCVNDEKRQRHSLHSAPYFDTHRKIFQVYTMRNISVGVNLYARLCGEQLN